jgi:hypothetical protein
MNWRQTGAAIGVLLLLAGGGALAEGELTAEMKPEGSVSREAGLEAWSRIHEVLSHPRCANCHVGEDNIPLWTTLDGEGTRPHGMNIIADETRIGAQNIPCSTCHVTSTLPNDTPHAPPHAGLDWQLAPVEMVWTGRTSAQICDQVRDPERNGDRDIAGLIEHITHDIEVRGFIAWGFEPGPGREPAPFGAQAHLDDFIAWGAAGMPCESD